MSNTEEMLLQVEHLFQLHTNFFIGSPIFPSQSLANCQMSWSSAFLARSSSSLPLGPCNYSDYLAQTHRQDTNHGGNSNNNAKSHAAPLTQCQVTSVSSPFPLRFHPDLFRPARFRFWFWSWSWSWFWPFDQRRHTAKEMRRGK